MSNEIVELPERKNRMQPVAQTQQVQKPGGLNERQMDITVEGNRQVIIGVVTIARDILEIVRIRSTATADVARLEAQTRDVVEKMKIEVQKISAHGESTLNRGRAAAAVIEATMKFIPESDAVARAKALDMLRMLVADATGERGNQDQK